MKGVLLCFVLLADRKTKETALCKTTLLFPIPTLGRHTLPAAGR
jgi:hypothetical protein